jgi:hypothetical protein
MYPNYYQQQTPLRPSSTFSPTIGLKGRPVSSLDEVRATTIDFDGSVFFFPDLANKRIYTKQINMDGTPSLCMYELKEIPTTPTQGSYVTREEFDAAMAQIKSILTPTPAPQQETTETNNNYSF